MKRKYDLIYDELAKQIQEGVIKPGTLLPSEKELTEQFETSRETIRKALNLLSTHGYIQKVQGKGSIVLDINKLNFPISGLVSFKELSEKMGQRAKSHVESLELLAPGPHLQEQLKVHEEEAIWEVIRVREIDKEHIILDKDYLLQSKIPDLPLEKCKNSLYEYIEGELGLSIAFAKKEITVEEPTDEDRKFLDLNGFSNVVVVKNFVYLEDASLFQYTESRHRPDKFRFIDFARRNK
ncbi:trehalose operon repressor [Bacillus sp. FJAT-44742]|uniref:trehalose operon repressor n=1 Tax=Bacillus sp. FJAT-44742 TaxID=2014005 RepID=UPI000C23B339|nr:trehalose operon repressor [Bacillus sp. FJAT-44742]